MSTGDRKTRKYRGSKTHGGGSMKKRRGAGSRGGRGRAGSGKKGDAKKPSYWKDWTLGKYGFTNSIQRKISKINITDLEHQVPALLAAGKATDKAGVITLDLKSLSIDKLLGTGRVTKKYSVTVEQASASAVKKITSAGGSVHVLKAPVEETEA